MTHQILRASAVLALIGGLSMLHFASHAATTPRSNASLAVPGPAEPSQLFLENGLQVVWEEDHRQPLVAIEARIRGGLRGEGPYVGTGITHFIEHMLFKGTPTRPAGTIEQEVRRYGGSINAFTGHDTTGITLFVESRHLREALVMLADILQHAVFEQTEFEKERQVIIDEIKMRQDDPSSRLWQLFWARHFLEHPYRHPIIGHQSLLTQLTVEDVAEFYRRQYQPQQITLACVGDLSGDAFPGMVREIFEGWPRGRVDPAQQLVPTEPPVATRKDVSLSLPLKTAYVMLGFSSTRMVDSETYPLDVLATILGQGRSSRLHETVVRTRRLADTIHAFNYTPFDAGVFGVQFRTSAERVDEATTATLEVLEQIKRGGIREEELDKAKRQVLAEYHFSRQTIESRAADLASSLAMMGDPSFSRRYVAGIEQVTAKAVQAAAVQYCDSARMTVATLVPEGQVTAKAVPAPAQPEALPVNKTVLDNGATMLTGEDHRLPIAVIAVAFRGGVRVETHDTQGLSNLVARMLTKGTSRHSASEIAARIEGLGGEISQFSGRDGFGLSLRLLSSDAAEGVQLAHELITESVFPEEELEIQRQLTLNELKAQDDEIYEVGSRLLRRTLFTRHPYRFDPLGTPESLQQVGRSDCVEFSSRWMTPDNMIVAVFGDIEPSAITDQLRQTFGSIEAKPSSWPAQLAADPLTEIRTASSRLEREQAFVVMGFRGGTRTAPDRHALDVMTTVFSGMAGRLFQAIREQHGLAYNLGAVHVPGWDPGYLLLYAATKPEEQDRVIAALEEQVRLAVEAGFTEAEVSQAKRHLIGQHRMGLQSLVSLTMRSTLNELYGLGFDAWRHYEARIDAVSVDAVHEVTQRYLTLPRRAQVVISPNGHRPDAAPR